MNAYVTDFSAREVAPVIHTGNFHTGIARTDNARIEANPLSPIGVMGASLPPVSITSASSY